LPNRAYDVVPTREFSQDVKRAQRRGYDMALLEDVIERLARGEKLDARYRDHQMNGKHKDCRNCHIRSDWVLVYRVIKAKNVLHLVGTGTHSDLDF
jgi:mRNA interferase YafQ